MSSDPEQVGLPELAAAVAFLAAFVILFIGLPALIYAALVIYH